MILFLPINHFVMTGFSRLDCYLKVSVLLVAISMSLSVHAEDKIQLSGFATLGVSAENKEDLGFLRDAGQSKNPNRDVSISPDSIIGAQLSSSFFDTLRATVQLVYRDRPRYGLDESIELAFLGYRPVNGFDLRLGRVAVDMFQLSDYRRVDYVNLWVRPPTEVYAWILPSSIDGGDLSYSFSNQNRFWRFKLQYGNTEPVLEFPDGSQLVETDFRDFLVGTLTLDVDQWRIRLSYSQGTPSSSPLELLSALEQVAALTPGPVGEEARDLARRFTDAVDGVVRYSQLSFGFDDGDWILDTEFTRIDTSDAIIPTGIAGFVSAGHRFENITPYASYSRFFTEQSLYASDVDWSASGFQLLRDSAIATLNGVLIEQHTYTLGLRWDFAPKMAFKAQWDNTHIEEGKFALWAHSNDRALEDTSVNVFSFALNFVF